MAAVDKMAAVWSAGIVAAAVGVALAASYAGSEPTAGSESPSPSALCESQGYDWIEGFGYCDISIPSVCEALGGEMVRGDLRALAPDDTFPDDAYFSVCELAGSEPTAGGEGPSPSALCESGGHYWIEGFGYCDIVVPSVCEALGGETICADPDALYPDYNLKPDVCKWVCVF